MLKRVKHGVLMAVIVGALGIVGTASGSAQREVVGGGGTLRIFTATEPTTLGYASGTSSLSDIVMRSVYQTLVGRDPKTYALVPELALSWKQLNSTTWQFQLRKSVRWTDGTALNAKTAVVSLRYGWDPANPDTGSFTPETATFKAVGKYTVRMTTATPDPVVPVEMTMVPLASSHQITYAKSTLETTPIGTGPYKVVSRTPGQSVTLKVNPQSWLATNGMYDTIDWEFRADPQVRADAVQAGEADITNTLLRSQCIQLPRCIGSLNTSISLIRFDSYNMSMMADPRVRTAMAMAINRTQIAKAIKDGAPVTNNVVAKGAIGFDPKAPKYPYDLTKAQALLAQAKAAGVNTDQPITVKYTPLQGPAQALVAQVVASDLKQLGFTKVSIVSVPLIQDFLSDYFLNRDPHVLTRDMPKDRNFVYISGSGNELQDAALTLGLLVTCTGVQSVICDPKIDAMQKASLTAPTIAARDKALRAEWEYAFGNGKLAILPLTNGYIEWAFSKKVADIAPTRNGILPLWLARPVK